MISDLDDLRSLAQRRDVLFIQREEIWLLIHISAADLFSLDEICCCWQLERREHLCCLSRDLAARDHLCLHPEIISVLAEMMCCQRSSREKRSAVYPEICFLLSSCRKKQFLSLRDENQLFLTAEIRTVLNCFLFCSFILLYLQHRDKYNFILFYFVLISAKYISVWNAEKNIYLFIFVLISAKYISVWNKK